MLPVHWHLLVIDLKDCFFNIPLHDEDKQRFAFTLPAINKEKPTQRTVSRRLENVPISLTFMMGEEFLMGAITQRKPDTGEFVVLEWLTTPLQPKTTIQQKVSALADLIKKGRIRLLQITGQEPYEIHVPISKVDLEWYLFHSTQLQKALLTVTSPIILKPLPSIVVSWMINEKWIELPKKSDKPLHHALTVFTDAGRRTRKAAATWKENDEWRYHLLEAQPGDTLKTLELLAVVWTLAHWVSQLLNIVTDSLYVAGVANRIEDSTIKDVKNPRLGQLLRQLRAAIAQRQARYAVLHIRSHQWQIGLGEGNAKADQLVSAAIQTPLSPFIQARETHAIFHQNAKGLAHMFGIPLAEARAIVKACPTCSQMNSGIGLGVGVNPKGLQANELWQMDVTHFVPFGKLKYLHVTIDTYSHAIWATPQSGKKANDVKQHLTQTFAVLGVPKTIKTDNGPAYISKEIASFFELWNVKHITGIPHSPTEQAVIEPIKC
ncbi:endogenous retrovirus group K member 8 Pol protein-like protein [Willisornis vidua]|uniref:RNA-directed DNA polymerase n=1 Tax=Willisornis vidua TaxID=1566151 RepID=A0ABQ9DUS8_9PASS|nr:endogenous retrovirus group K member 8 Pol protein-like protein [Willisornis vidua]